MASEPQSARRAYFDPRLERLIVQGRERTTDDTGDTFVLHTSDLGALTVRQLEDAMRATERHRWGSVGQLRVAFADTESTSFDEDYSARKPYAMSFHPDRVDIELYFDSQLYEDDLDQSTIAGWIRPLLDRHRIVFVGAEPHQSGPPDPPWLWILSLSASPSRRRLIDLVEGLEQIGELLGAYDGGRMSRESIRDIVLAGHATAIIGQQENSWLEAKSSVYDLSNIRGKINLAQSVARFANSPDGGLIVFGVRTRQSPQGERLARLTPIPRDPTLPRRLRHVLQHHLYPPVERLHISMVDADRGHLVLIDVPPQPSSLLPFLVHGAIVGDRVEGSFIGIVRRVEDESIATTAPMIHATLAAGRALLRQEG